MTFAWQGFQIEHPEDWAPALISGNRQEGYVRIASPDDLSLQIRWKKHPQDSKSLSKLLPGYLRQLERDSKKTKTKFTSRIDGRDEGTWRYQWKGAGNGTGSLLWFHDRAFFIEASSLSNRSTNSQHDRLVSTFQSHQGDREPWMVFGLEVLLPTGFGVEKHLFQSGRTRIEWRDRSTRIAAERWGFGEQILARHTFEQWAMDSMAMPKAKITEVNQGLELSHETLLLKTYGLATCHIDRNQLVTLKVTCRSPKGRPDWDWLI